MDMTELEAQTQRIREFCQARDWDQFHNAKDMALSLVLEAAEVLEHFQWKSEAEMDEHVNGSKREIAEELADTYYWILRMCDRLQIDLPVAFEAKMKKNEIKYPIDKAKGKHSKYSQL
jgi:NTP pyrophosphatase (non-canonical NTP hydrolase)